MNIYKVPFDFAHEGKIFGGYLSLRQAIYIVLGISSAGILFIPHIPMIFKVIIFLTTFIAFLIFAFLKINEVYADRHFLNIIKYIFRKKIYLSER